VVIFAKGGAHGNSISLAPLTPSGASFTGISAALVFGFLTYIGFEGSAALGEESDRPQIAIPLTVFSAVILAGLVFIIISLAQTIGFGLDDAGVKAYASSAAPNTDLAQSFVGSWFAMVLNAGAAISTFACALASADGAARVVFSLSRDERLPSRLATVHPQHHSPHWALGVSMVLGLLIAGAFVPFTDSPSNVYGWSGALATLAVIIAYGMTSIAASIYFWKEDMANHRYYHIIPLVVALPLLAYTFYSQIVPVPPAPLRYWPYVMLVFLAIGFVILYMQRHRVVKRDAAWEDRHFAAEVEGSMP